jgi:hypothetical protein
MDSPAHAFAGAQLDGCVRDGGSPGEGLVGWLGIGDQQHILVEHRAQMLMQLGRGDGAAAGDEIEGRAGAVARHQHADVFRIDAAPARHAAALARRPVQPA